MSKLILILACLLSTVAHATTYYIDYVNGDDANSGTSTASAWKHYPMDTRATGVSDATTIGPGDVLAPKGGEIYVPSLQRLVPNGAVGNPVIVDGALWGTGKAIEDGNYQCDGAWNDGNGAERGNFTFRNIIYRHFGGYPPGDPIWLGITISGVDTGTDVLTSAADHGLVVGDDVQFTLDAGGAMPTPLLAGTNGVEAIYYVKTVPSSTTFTLSATNGGTTINMTGVGSGTIKAWEPVLAPPDAKGFYISRGGENMTWEGLEFYEFAQWQNQPPMRNTNSVTGLGFWLESTNNALIKDCVFKRMKGGLLVTASASKGPSVGVKIQNSQFSEYMMWAMDVAPLGPNATIIDTEITGCRVFDMTEHDDGNWRGFGDKPHTNGIFLRNSFYSGVTWTNNRINGCVFSTDITGASKGGTADIFISQGPSALIYNCVFFRPKKTNGAISVGWDSQSPGQVVRVYNNTFYGDATMMNANGELRAGYRSVHVANNIFFGNDPASNRIYVNQTAENRLYDTLNRNLYFHASFNESQFRGFVVNGWQWATLPQVQSMGVSPPRPTQFEANGRFANPLISDTVGTWLNTNWRVQAGSPAIAMGENLSAYFTTDADGNARPASGLWTVGAYEYGGAPPADVTAPTLLSATCNAEGAQIALVFSEPVQGIDLAHYGIAGHTLSALTGAGANWTFSIAPVRQAGPDFSMTYTSGAGRTRDAAGNLLPTGTSTVVNNSLETTPTPARAQRRGPGGGRRKPFGF